MLLDGVHLVADAIAAGARVREAAVAAASIDDPVVRGLVNRLISGGVDVVSVAAPVMAALSGVRSSSAMVALADRPRLDDSGVPRPRLGQACGHRRVREEHDGGEGVDVHATTVGRGSARRIRRNPQT